MLFRLSHRSSCLVGVCYNYNGAQYHCLKRMASIHLESIIICELVSTKRMTSIRLESIIDVSMLVRCHGTLTVSIRREHCLEKTEEPNNDTHLVQLQRMDVKSREYATEAKKQYTYLASQVSTISCSSEGPKENSCISHCHQSTSSL